MVDLFAPIRIGQLELPNRFIRSATAEFLGEPQSGAPMPLLADMYRSLAEGGVGLIITGHSCVEMAGRTHPYMCSLSDDNLIPAWRETIAPAQAAGARVMIQLNHGGANVDPQATPNPLSPSGVPVNDRAHPRPLTEDEILRIIDAFGQAARRAREAGFDGVQIHGAHGYLVTQFLTPHTNRRQDRWGGDEIRRWAFLGAVIASVRSAVGDDYPVWIKLGVAGKAQGGLDAAQGARHAARCAQEGIDCIEISHAWGIPEECAIRSEAPFRSFAEAVRRQVSADYPLALVYGLRELETMQALVDSGLVQFLSLCRPFIAEPDLVARFRSGKSTRVACTRCDDCRPKAPGEGIACHNQAVLKRLARDHDS